MFSPEGFVPVSELWESFQEKRLSAFYRTASEHYHADNFIAAFVRGSPLDICEHTFLKSLTKVGLFLASPSGRVMKIHAPLNDGYASLCSVREVYESARHWEMHQAEADKISEGITLETRHYRPWASPANDEEAWKRAYPNSVMNDDKALAGTVDSLTFHSLSLCFERTRYTVVTHLPPWTRDIKRKSELELLVTHFAGWAMCFPESTLPECNLSSKVAASILGHSSLSQMFTALAVPENRKLHFRIIGRSSPTVMMAFSGRLSWTKLKLKPAENIANRLYDVR